MNADLQTPSYVDLYPQPAIGGLPGLTSMDFARALRWRHAEIHRSLGERGYVEKLRRVTGCNITSIDVKTGRRGRPTKLWVLDAVASKIFLAQTRTDEGVGYVRYLIECERIAEQVAPRRIAELEAQIADLTAPKTRRLPRGHNVRITTRVMHFVDLFGEARIQVIRERKPIENLSAGERRLYAVQHRAATMRGIAAKQDHDLNPPDEGGLQ